jgi:hypothetical protein
MAKPIITITHCGLVTAMLIVFILLYIVSQLKTKEGFWFTSPGTLVQLQTSHVTTEDDLREMLRERQRVYRDIYNMTGSY